MANGYLTGTMQPATNQMAGIPQRSLSMILVDETTPNLEEIQSFPVIYRNGNVHIHQDPSTSQMYQMTDEFHSRIPQILAGRASAMTGGVMPPAMTGGVMTPAMTPAMTGGVMTPPMTGGVMTPANKNQSLELRAISLDPSNIMSSQMDKISSLNYVKSNSKNYVNGLTQKNAAINDIFYSTALNSREHQGSFFYLNENGFSSKESFVFDNQLLFMQDSRINSAIKNNINQNGVFVMDSTPTNIPNRNIVPIQILQSKVPVKFTYPSLSSTANSNMNRNSAVVSQTTVQYVYPINR